MNIPFTVRQRRAVLSVLIALAVIVAVSAVTCISLAFVEKDVTFKTYDLTLTYGEKPDFSEFSVSVENMYGTVTEHSVSADDIEYDTEEIGEQTAYLKYKNKRQPFKIIINAKKLDTPDVKITDGVIEWNEIEGAGYYSVLIDDVSYSVNVNRYDLSEFPQVGTLTVRVTAQPATGDGRYLISEVSQSVTITKLNPIDNLQYKNGEFIWDSVEGAIGYSVTVNGNAVKVNDNRYPFDEFTVGTNRCTVYALGDDYHWSGDKATLTLEKLAPAENISYDWKTGRISWGHPDDDVMFTVYVNDTKVEDTYNRFAEFTFTPAVNYRVSVIAGREKALSSEQTVKLFTVTILQKPVISCADGVISWGAVPNTETYEIYVDNNVRTQNGCSISVTELTAGEHTVKVRSYSEGGIFISSDYAVITFINYANVSNLTYNRETSQFVWNSVSGAKKYEITVNGINYQTSTNKYTYEGNFTEGANKVSVNVIPESEKHIAGKSAELVLYKLQKVRNVVFSGTYLVWEDDNAGCLYKIEVEGKTYTAREKKLELVLDKRTFIRITAYSESSNTLASEVYEESFTTTTLATPSVTVTPNIQYAGSYDIKITPVSFATSYSVTVYVYASADSNDYLIRTFTLDNVTTERTIDATGKYKLYIEVVALDSTENYNSSAAGKAEYQIKK